MTPTTIHALKITTYNTKHPKKKQKHITTSKTNRINQTKHISKTKNDQRLMLIPLQYSYFCMNTIGGGGDAKLLKNMYF